MAGIFGYSKEAIRVKVKKCEGVLQPEFRKFSVDPQITSFEVLQSILAKAFDIKDEFTICYKTIDDWGQEIHVSILSDWDLDAAFLRAHNISLTNGSEPSLCLRVDLKQFSESSEEWDVTNSIPMTRVPLPEIKASPRLPGLIMNQVEKTFNMVQRALNFGEDGNIVLHPPRQPLSDSEFRRFLDPVGQIVHVKELRSVIYYGGIDPSLRKVVWKHILNVYPEGMSGKERMNYMKRKASEYYSLRDFWKELLQKGPVTGDLAYTTSMVRKDVLRTDRHHTFYAGSDDNLNIASLFNILTTYALHHPKVSYCQGMSDLASPLLVTMNDEAHAYICFCALMSRLGHNFMLDGIAMTQKFTHLAEALQFYDPEFYGYLKSHQADDLLFCYRWLLLEMKREFAFDDSLRMLEVLWSSLPAVPPVNELPLYETKFKPPAIVTPPISPLVKTPRENAYTKVCALRRQNSAMSIASWAGATNQNVRANVTRQNHSLDEPLSNSFNCEKVKACQSLDDAIISADMPEVFKPVSPVEIKPVLINNANQKQEALSAISSSVNNLITKSGFQKSNFKDLKDRFVSSKKGLFQSLDKTDNANMIREEQETDKKPGRIVRNFNEFLNFASINRNLANKYIKNNDPDKPVITLTSSSFDEAKSNDVSLKSSSCDSSPEEYFPMTTSITRELKLELESLDRQVFGTNHHPQVTETPTENLNLECIETPTETSESIDSDETVPMCLQLTKDSKCRKQEDIFVWENPLHQQSPAEIQSAKYSAAQGEETEYDGESGEIFEESQNGVKSVTPIRVVKKIQTSKKIKPSISTDTIETPMSQVQTQNKENNICMDHLNGVCPQMTNSCEEATENANNARTCNMDLPPPHEFGGGNPFLMFLCITVLLQHRDYVMQNSMDYNEMAMHFDKMVRKHNVIRVLNQARQMFAAYMKACSSGAQQNSNSVSSNGHVNT